MPRRSNQQVVSTLIATKLKQPVLPTTLVLLPRLFARLEAGYQAGITLVSAPTGFGKTTLIAAWLAERAKGSSTPAAWISLDAQDDNLTRFLSYFCEAIALRFPDVVLTTHRQLKDVGSISPELMLATLIDDLEAIPGHFVIVLDDFHRVHIGEVQQMVAQLLRNRPSNCHIVLIARTDPAVPVAHLRAQGKLVDLRSRDLRFTLAETTQLVQAYAEGRLSNRDVDMLQQQTEGWVAGLHLALLALHGEPDSEGYINAIPARHEFVMQYLLEEVFNRQPEMIQQCLLKTSILLRFNAGLIEAVAHCRAEDRDQTLPIANGHELIDWLMNAGLFVVALDQKSGWYRYHQFFIDFLQERLRLTHGAAAIAGFHLRASRWYVDEHLIDEAITHALLAGDMDMAAEIVENAANEAFSREQFLLVKLWLERLPTDLINRRVRLLLALCWIDMNRWRLAEIRSLLPSVERLLAGETARSPVVSDTRPLLGELAALHCLVTCFANEGEASLAYGYEALAHLAPEHRLAVVTTKLCIALAMQLAGDLEGAYIFLDKEILECQAEGRGLEVRLLTSLEFIAWYVGDLQRLEQAARIQGERSRAFHLAASEGFSHLFIGVVHYQRNELAQAKTAFSYFSTPHSKGFNNGAWMYGLYWLAITEERLGNHMEATALAELAMRIALERSHTRMLATARLLRRQLALLRNDLALAAQDSFEWSLPNPFPISLFTVPDLLQAAYLLALGTQADLLAAKQIADAWLDYARGAHVMRRVVEVLALRAAVLQAMGKAELALADLREALLLAEPRGLVRCIADVGAPVGRAFAELTDAEQGRLFVRQIMALLPSAAEDKRAAPMPPLSLHVTLLTAREMDVLLLMSQRYSDKEIAVRLCISVATVKRHTANIYEKLHVGGRRQAVAAAQSLGILPSTATSTATSAPTSFIHP